MSRFKGVYTGGVISFRRKAMTLFSRPMSAGKSLFCLSFMSVFVERSGRLITLFILADSCFHAI
jgi:hypothetical protein